MLLPAAVFGQIYVDPLELVRPWSEKRNNSWALPECLWLPWANLRAIFGYLPILAYGLVILVILSPIYFGYERAVAKSPVRAEYGTSSRPTPLEPAPGRETVRLSELEERQEARAAADELSAQEDGDVFGEIEAAGFSDDEMEAMLAAEAAEMEEEASYANDDEEDAYGDSDDYANEEESYEEESW